jgi:hypothetical protein
MPPLYQPPVPFSPNVNTGAAPVMQASQCVDVNLTSAQILALFTTPVTLIPAPGAGFMLLPESIIIRVAGGTAYTDGGGGAVTFAVGSMTSTLSANTIFTGPTAGQQSQQSFAFGGLSTAAAPSTNVNAPLTISKATANFAAGTGTCHITVYYTIEPAV